MMYGYPLAKARKDEMKSESRMYGVFFWPAFQVWKLR